MRRFRLASLFVVCMAVLFFAVPSDSARGDKKKGVEKEFTAIFDGKSLEGWEGSDKIFRVENGAIVAGNLKEKIANNEFLCTKKRYENFELRLQAKLVGEGKNAGIQFRSDRIPNHHEVKGYQCDVGVMADRSIWGSLYDESRRRKFLAHGDAEKLSKFPSEKWNDIVVRCSGKKIEIWVNDVKTVDYLEEEDGIPSDGIIGLQIHGGAPAEASYRNIRIKSL
ncbi:MAG: hypothetical protein ACI9G1_005639 [Pirellulaceae bacterium]|jgi:hypothetical protein